MSRADSWALVRRYLTLPFYCRVAVAESLGVVVESLDDREFDLKLFQTAKEQGLADRLREEVEAQHGRLGT